jgi:two-component system chemotaxis response regulator CheB
MSSAVRPVRVMVVDDSVVVRGVFGRIIDAQPDMKVATTAANGRAAIEALRQVEIDVVLLDVEMPEMDGLAALPQILAMRPNVRVIMASSLTMKGATVTMTALGLGAADFVHKPVAKGGTASMDTVAKDLVEKIRALGRRAQSGPHVAVAPAAASITHAPVRVLTTANDITPRVLAIASSTGGPNALAELLAALPHDFPLPILITQHMPPLFTTLLAERLTRDSGRPCIEAREGDAIVPGRAYIAPGDWHMTVRTMERKPIIRLVQSAHENHCRPAADPMFRSVASIYGASVLAVVLTGMGEDGRRGCQVIVENGGKVVAQDEASSVVWGMPGAVVEAGLASAILPLKEIAAHVCKLTLVGGGVA